MGYRTFTRCPPNASFLTILVLVGALTACAPSTMPPRSIDRTCDWLQEPHLQTLSFGAMTMEEFENWLRGNYGIDKIEYKNAYPAGSRTNFWQKDGKKYAANFYEDRLVRIDIYWEEPYPTGRSFINCFGSPSFYDTLYQQEIEARSLSLELWYPILGIQASAYLLCRANCPPSIDEQTGLSGMSFFAPRESVEDVLPFLYNSPAASKNILESLRPWPGDWSAIVTDGQPKSQ